MSSRASRTLDLPAPDMPVTSSSRGKRRPAITDSGPSELQAHPLERQRDFRWGGGGHGVDADQGQGNAEDRTLAVIVRQALDVAGQLDKESDRNILARFHVHDADTADLELA